MRSFLSLLAFVLLAPSGHAGGNGTNPLIEVILMQQVLAGTERLASSAQALSAAASRECENGFTETTAAFNAGVDAWFLVSDFRFGPIVENDRQYKIAFWPDKRGAGMRRVRSILIDGDPAIDPTELDSELPIAARGLYALELLLFEPDLKKFGPKERHCAYTRAVSNDIAAVASELHLEWIDWANEVLSGFPNRYYPGTEKDFYQDVFTALLNGLELTADHRIKRPLGTATRPRPNLAEMRRSLRSQRNIIITLSTQRALAKALTGEDRAT